MSDTLSAIVSSPRKSKTSAALYVGLAGDSPFSPPARVALAGIDRVDVGRAETRAIAPRKIEGADVVVLALADARMSSTHARITRIGGTWVLEDLGSKNGTWIAGSKVQRHTLADGDAILVGHTMLVFRTSGGEAGDHDGEVAAMPGLATLCADLAERFRELATAAKSNIPIEITGETGTGKELVAQAVHVLSGRGGKFVPVNCGALPHTMVEAELFGHKKGAFTGAAEDRPGLVRSADGGTLFLDEIAELPSVAQATLLRVLQEHEVTPIGSDKAISVNLRFVTATHRTLDADVADDRFREDLRARLLGFAIALPPLRQRREDLGLLVGTLVRRHAQGRPIAFSADAVAALYLHDWPLNVRELERSLAAAIAVAGERIELHHLPTSVGSTDPIEQPVFREIDDDERTVRDQLAAALAKHDGNVAAVGREMGKDPTQIRRWMKKFGLKRD